MIATATLIAVLVVLCRVIGWLNNLLGVEEP